MVIKFTQIHLATLNEQAGARRKLITDLLTYLVNHEKIFTSHSTLWNLPIGLLFISGLQMYVKYLLASQQTNIACASVKVTLLCDCLHLPVVASVLLHLF